jgi:hypothetical protein
MTHDPETIELPPPQAEPVARDPDDHTSIEPDDLGHQPIDDPAIGVDREPDNAESNPTGM